MTIQQQPQLRGKQYFSYLIECSEYFQNLKGFDPIEDIHQDSKRRFFIHDAVHYLSGYHLNGDEQSNEQEEMELYVINLHLVLNNLVRKELVHLDKNLVFIIRELMR